MSELRSRWFFECTLQEARKETAKSTNEAEEEKDAAKAAAKKEKGKKAKKKAALALANTPMTVDDAVLEDDEEPGRVDRQRGRRPQAGVGPEQTRGCGKGTDT